MYRLCEDLPVLTTCIAMTETADLFWDFRLNSDRPFYLDFMCERALLCAQLFVLFNLLHASIQLCAC